MINRQSVEIINHPFYKAADNIVNQIIREVRTNLKSVGPRHTPEDCDRELFYPYGNWYIRLSSINHYHPQFFFDIGQELLDEATEHEKKMGAHISKEGIYAVRAICAVMKNDLFQYRINLERMLMERGLYDPVTLDLANLINNEPVFYSVKREANLVFDENCVIRQLKDMRIFNEFDFLSTLSKLSPFHQKQWLTYVLNYRLLHVYLGRVDCPNYVHDQCYGFMQDVCVLFESALKDKKGSTKRFWGLLSQKISEPYKSNLLTVLNLSGRYPVHSITDFNTHFPSLLEEFKSLPNSEDIICYCIYICYICRNQILHNLTSRPIFHGNGEMTEKLIGILLTSIYAVDCL